MKQAQKGLTRTKGETDPGSEEWAGVWAGKEVKAGVRAGAEGVDRSNDDLKNHLRRTDWR